MNLKKLNEKLDLILNESKENIISYLQNKAEDLANKNRELSTILYDIKSINQENKRLGYEHVNKNLSYEDMTDKIEENEQKLVSLEKQKESKQLAIAQLKQDLIKQQDLIKKQKFVTNNLLVPQETLDEVLNIVSAMVDQYNKDDIRLTYPVEVKCTAKNISITLYSFYNLKYDFSGFTVNYDGHKVILRKSINLNKIWNQNIDTKQLNEELNRILNEVEEYTFKDWFGEDLTGQTYEEDLYCNENNLTSLEGCPKVVNGDFNCEVNKLTSLKGCPERVEGDFNCADNLLTSLKGSPKYVGGDFNCSYNRLVSLEGKPEYIGGDIDDSFNDFATEQTLFFSGSIFKGPLGFGFLVGTKSEDLTLEDLGDLEEIVWEDTYDSCVESIEAWMKDEEHESVSVGNYSFVELLGLNINRVTPVYIGEGINAIADFEQYAVMEE